MKAWKTSGKRKALLVKGARQVGKTTAVRAFAKAEYKNFIEINFEQTPVARQAFSGNLDARTIIMNLSAMGYGPFEKGETLVFLTKSRAARRRVPPSSFLLRTGLSTILNPDRFLASIIRMSRRILSDLRNRLTCIRWILRNFFGP